MNSNARLFTILAIAGLLCFGIIGLAQISNNEVGNNNGDDKKKNTEKRIEIQQNNGDTKVKITTIEDGKTTIEVYEGEEAEKYLEEQGHSYGTYAKGSHGNSHYNFQNGFGQLDSMLNNMNFDWDGNFNDMLSEEYMEKLKKMMEELEEHDFKMDFDFDFDNMDEWMKNFADSSNFNIQIFDGSNMEELQEMLKNMDIDINIDMNSTNPSSKNVRKIIVARSVTIEDIETSKKGKDLTIEDLKFYPNPTNGQFTLEFFVPSKGTTNITIHNMQGKLVYSDSVNGEGSHKQEIDISDAGNGTYILNLSQGKKSTSKKIVIN